MIINDDPNTQMSNKLAALAPSSTASQIKAQEEARTTVLDKTRVAPQFEGNGYGAINTKAPDMHVYSATENAAVSTQHTH